MGVSNYLHEHPFEISAIVEQPTDIIVISHDVIDLHCDILTKEILKNYNREYPHDSEVKKMFCQTLKWTQFKKSLYDEKVYETKRMTRLRRDSREVMVPKPSLPKDILAFICNKPKPLFFSKKKKSLAPVPESLSSKAPTTHKLEASLRQDYESSGTQSKFVDLETDLLPTAYKTLDLDERWHDPSRHFSVD